MARVSTDHADESLSAESMGLSRLHSMQTAPKPRLISPDEVRQHSGKNGSDFWAVVDGFVVDATELVSSHPGGLKKLLSTNSADVGATGKEFGFSFARGRNAHFPDTGKRFHEGIKAFLKGASDEPILPPRDVVFSKHGKIVILGRLAN